MPQTSVVPVRDHLRGLLYALIPKGNAPARTVRRAHTLLLADAPPPGQPSAARWPTAAVPGTQTGKRFRHAGLEAAL
jgi:hypothetical protein